MGLSGSRPVIASVTFPVTDSDAMSYATRYMLLDSVMPMIYSKCGSVAENSIKIMLSELTPKSLKAILFKLRSRLQFESLKQISEHDYDMAVRGSLGLSYPDFPYKELWDFIQSF